ASIWESREKDMGKEVFEGAQRFVALQALDNLWMEHLDTMDHLRDSVRLRGYGQRDPLVEYKKEGYEMFQRLIAEINKQIVYTIFHISVNPPAGAPQPLNLVTNRGSQLSMNESAQDSRLANIGRNDPCPCGSGKKWKKCGMLNTPEHQANMAKGTGQQHRAKVGG
ncbi:MAG TPA: SEC-C metal-binding domain-containing protein, partial [Patescibacteria group bacterium]|nr:SEC-C metal-binding domain-containing protein [Patescibacteria group bacterium]